MRQHIKLMLNNAEQYIPKGYCCVYSEGKEWVRCPFYQLRKVTKSRFEQFKVIVDENTGEYYYFLPYNTNRLEYCSYLKKYLSVQDMIKDCEVNEE